MFVSIVCTSLANLAMPASVFVASVNPTVSPHPPIAIMILAPGNSVRIVEIGVLGWKVAVALAAAKARTTWSIPSRSAAFAGRVGCHL